MMLQIKIYLINQLFCKEDFYNQSQVKYNKLLICKFQQLKLNPLMASENNRQLFFQVKQKLDFYRLPTTFPLEATQLLYKVFNKLDSKHNNDTDRTRQSNYHNKIQSEAEKTINLKIKKIIIQNNKLHQELIQSKQHIQILKSCTKSHQKKGQNNFQATVIDHLKARELQLFQQLVQVKYKYNQLMDLIHEDPNVQKKYIKRLLKHKKLEVQQVKVDANFQTKIAYKIGDEKHSQSQEIAKLKLLKQNLVYKVQNRQLEILRLQKFIQNQLNVESILKQHQVKKNKQQLSNIRYQNDLLISKLTNIQNKSKSKQKHSKEVIQKLKSPKKISVDKQRQNKSNQTLMNRIIKLQQKNKAIQKQNIQLKKQLQTKIKQLQDISKSNKLKVQKTNTTKMVKKIQNQDQNNKVSFQNQLIRGRYNQLPNKLLQDQNLINQQQELIEQLNYKIKQLDKQNKKLQQQDKIKLEAITKLQSVIRQLNLSKDFNENQITKNQNHHTMTPKYPPRPYNQKQKKQRKGSLDSIKEANLKTTNIMTTQVNGTLTKIEEQSQGKHKKGSIYNLTEYAGLQNDNKSFSQNMELDIKSDFDNNYPSNIHSKITQFKNQKQSSKHSGENGNVNVNKNGKNENFKISVTKAGQKVGEQYLYLQKKQESQKQKVEQDKKQKLDQKAQKIQVLRQKTAQQAIKNIKKQQKQIFQQLQIEPEIDSSDKASVFSMRKQIDELKIQNRKQSKQNKKFQKQIKQLEEERDRFQRQLKLLQEKIGSSGGDFPRIIRDQQTRISELQQSNIQTQLKIKDKDFKISSLQNKLQNLSQKVQTLTSNLTKLEQENHQLRKQRQKLLQRQKQYVDTKNEQLSMKMQNQQKQNRNNSLQYSSQILWLKKSIKNLQQKIQKYAETINELNDFVAIHRKQKQKLSIEKIGYLKQNQYLKKKLLELQRALQIQSQQMNRYRETFE